MESGARTHPVRCTASGFTDLPIRRSPADTRTTPTVAVFLARALLYPHMDDSASTDSPDVPDLVEIPEGTAADLGFKLSQRKGLSKDLSREAIRAMMLTEANSLILQPWEKQLCDWLSTRANPKKVTSKDLKTVAVAFSDSPDITHKQLKTLMEGLAWRKRWERNRRSFLDADLAESREKAIALVGKGMVIYDELLTQVQEDKDVRGGTPLVTALLDRALPKKTESSTVATQITVTLTPEQAVGLNAPVRIVEAREVASLPAQSE